MKQGVGPFLDLRYSCSLRVDSDPQVFAGMISFLLGHVMAGTVTFSWGMYLWGSMSRLPGTPPTPATPQCCALPPAVWSADFELLRSTHFKELSYWQNGIMLDFLSLLFSIYNHQNKHSNSTYTVTGSPKSSLF